MLPFRAPAEVSQIILYHHEAFDGSGYPHGLQGEGIPLLARIVSMVQTFDHLVAGRPALPALSMEEAGKQIRREAGTRYDPILAELFSSLIGERKVPCPPPWRWRPSQRPCHNPETGGRLSRFSAHARPPRSSLLQSDARLS